MQNKVKFLLAQLRMLLQSQEEQGETDNHRFAAVQVVFIGSKGQGA